MDVLLLLLAGTIATATRSRIDNKRGRMMIINLSRQPLTELTDDFVSSDRFNSGHRQHQRLRCIVDLRTFDEGVWSATYPSETDV